MNDKKTKLNTEQLYKRYQETRDDIPLSTFKAISMATDAAQHELAIHAIAQAAKVASTASVGNATDIKSSWLTTIIEKIKSSFVQNELSKPIGIGFACLAVFAAVGPLVLNTTSTPYFAQEVAHFNGCAECQTHIRNALITTRGASPTFTTLSAESRCDAKLGLIQGRLHIESTYADQDAINNAIVALSKLDKNRFSAKLNALISDGSGTNKPIKPETLSLAIANSVNQQTISRASNAIFVANISVRNASNGMSLKYAQTALLTALTAMQQLTAPTPLQETAISKLERSANTAAQMDLKKALKNLEQAARSMGV